MRARYYSPDMRRFVNADIVAGEISNAVTLNRFAYANGNPVSFVDPFGLSVWSWLNDKYSETEKWLADVGEKVVSTGKNVFDAIVNFFDPDSFKKEGGRQDGIYYESGSVSAGNFEFD